MILGQTPVAFSVVSEKTSLVLYKEINIGGTGNDTSACAPELKKCDDLDESGSLETERFRERNISSM
jgi:hypothetical protein